MTTINFEAGHGGECAALAAAEFPQLASGRYTYPASILRLPASIEEHLAAHRTFRKRAARARNLGYRFAEVARELYEDDIYRINTSAPERQGRPMSEGYTRPVKFSPLPDYPCGRHAIRTYGVLAAGRLGLVAYTWVYRIGDLVMFSQILGHAAFLAHDIMYELMRGALAAEIAHGPGVAFYNRHDSGTPGLRYYKERVGFRPGRVDWRLQ